MYMICTLVVHHLSFVASYGIVVAMNYTDVVLMADSGAELQAMLDVVEACVSRWKVKFNR